MEIAHSKTTLEKMHWKERQGGGVKGHYKHTVFREEGLSALGTHKC